MLLFCVVVNESGMMLACSGAGVSSSASTFGVIFGMKIFDLSCLDVWMVLSEV